MTRQFDRVAAITALLESSGNREFAVRLHLVRLTVITTLIVLCMIGPYLPGHYDALAIPVSYAVQLLGIAGLFLVPISIPWLAYELRKARGTQNPSARPRSSDFVTALLIAASPIAIIASMGLFLNFGATLGALSFALSGYAVVRWFRKLRLMRQAEPPGLDPTPLYLAVVPPVFLLFHLILAATLPDFSRNRAIAHAAPLIDAIEAHRAAQGRYPASLLAVHADYPPGVSGIETFHYAPHGDTYQLIFEQPRLLLDNPGTREFVVYNPRDTHAMSSHAAWILKWPPGAWPARTGWYAVHDAGRPHWKRFLFD